MSRLTADETNLWTAHLTAVRAVKVVCSFAIIIDNAAGTKLLNRFHHVVEAV
jgi:hypothetical protein